MQELGRIYWTRQGLRLAYSALMVWLAVAVMTALMPKGTSVAGTAPSSAAEHGDHFYPWSKGGSTSLQNFVATCARCNRAKRARIPSPAQQQRLERRRRDYVPPSSSVSVGERQPFP